MKKALLYSLLGLSLSSTFLLVSVQAQADPHVAPQVSTNDQFIHLPDYIDISTEQVKNYLSHHNVYEKEKSLFNHVGKESGDNGNVNTVGAKGRYNEMFDSQLEFSNVLERDNLIGDQVMAKYRDTHDMLWLKVRQQERYNAERERLYSLHRGETGWKDMSNGIGTPKTVHLDVYGARVGNYRAEQLSSFRQDTDKDPTGASNPHMDDFGRNGGDIQQDHMNTDRIGANENLMSPLSQKLGTKIDPKTGQIVVDPITGKVVHERLHNPATRQVLYTSAKPSSKGTDIREVEKFLYNAGEIDKKYHQDGYSAFVQERVNVVKDQSGQDVVRGQSDHLAHGLPQGPSNPDWHPVGHFVNIMTDSNENAPGASITERNNAITDGFGFKVTNFKAPLPVSFTTINGKEYLEYKIKSPHQTLLSWQPFTLNGKNVDIYNSKGDLIISQNPVSGGSVSNKNLQDLWDASISSYVLYIPVTAKDKTQPEARVDGALWDFSSGTKSYGGLKVYPLAGIDPDTPLTNKYNTADTGKEKKTGDDFRQDRIKKLFTTTGAIQTALLSGPFTQKQAIVNYQNIEVDGTGKIALDDPKELAEYDYTDVYGDARVKLDTTNVAYLSNRGLVMATNGAKGVKLNDTDIFVNEGLLYADDKSVAIEMNSHNNIIQFRNDLIQGIVDGGAGQDTLLLSKPRHQMDELGNDKQADPYNKYVVNGVHLKDVEQIHAQSGDWYFTNGSMDLQKSTLTTYTILPWTTGNDASGLTDTYDYTPQTGNITFQEDITVDGSTANPLIYANKLKFDGNVTIKDLKGKLDLSKIFNSKELYLDPEHIKIDGMAKDQKPLVVTGAYDRPVTGLVTLAQTSITTIGTNATPTIQKALQATDKTKVGKDQIGDMATADTYNVTDQISSAGATTDGAVGVWSGYKGRDITIQKSVIMNGNKAKAVELNGKNNILTIQDDMTGMIDTGAGDDQIILDSQSATTKNINSELVGVGTIQADSGTWIFNGDVELSAGSNPTSSTDDDVDYSDDDEDDDGNALVRGYAPYAGSPTPYSGTSPASPPPPAPARKLSTVEYKGKLTLDVDPLHGKSSYILADTVKLDKGYYVHNLSLTSTPNLKYNATLIDTPNLIDSSGNPITGTQKQHTLLWDISTTADNTGLHTSIKGNDMNYSSAGGAVLDGNPLIYNDDVTFSISNQVAKYRNNSIIGENNKYLDFSITKDSKSDYQDLSLIETHLNMSTPALTNLDKRNAVSFQAGFYHGSGSHQSFSRSVNAYTIGSGLKLYNPLHKKNKTFLKNLWLNVGVDLGMSRQYDIKRYDDQALDTADKGKENDLFATTTVLTGTDISIKFKSKSKFKNKLKFTLTPYAGLGINLTELGKYSEKSVNPLTLDSQSRFNIYGIAGIHAKTGYKFSNNQSVDIGAGIQADVRFDNSGKNRTGAYAGHNKFELNDNNYNSLPITLTIDGNYNPTKNISIYTKLSATSQKIYSYSGSIGANIKF